MTTYAPDYPTQWEPLANDAADSSFRGNPMSVFYKGGRVGTKPIAVRVPREPGAYAKGGLATEARRVRDAGVGGDELIVHINRKEFDELRRHWGEPTINPHTGMPQFTPFWKQSWFAPVAALASAALMATGIGAPLGAALLPTALAGETILGAALPSIVGNALIGAGVGGITGGGKGAIIGGLTGGLGTVAGGLLGSSLPGVTSAGEEGLSGWWGRMGSGDFLSQGATASSLGSAAGSGINATTGAASAAGSGINASTGAASAAGIPTSATGMLSSMGLPASAAESPGLLASLGGAKTLIPAALLAATAFGGSGGQAQPATQAGQNTPIDPNMTRRLAVAPLSRTRRDPGQDYFRYGSLPEATFYDQQPAQPVQAATGGPLSRFVRGGGSGRSDSIDAKLSDGEYVIDAETVSLLGDGSSKAGAERLDQFRANVRRQKGRELAKGKFSPNAKRLEEYI